MRHRSVIWLFITLVFLVPLSLYGLYVYYETEFARLPVFGKALLVDGKKTDHSIDSFMLTNQEGNIITMDSWNNKIVVANFFFTHCPAICPKMTTSLKMIQKEFSENEVCFNSFSVDPERDSAERLRAYIRKFDIHTANWQFITGDKKQIYKLARNSFLIVATDGDGGPDDFIHTEKLMLIDNKKRIRGYYSGINEKEVKMLIRDIKKLKYEN